MRKARMAAPHNFGGGPIRAFQWSRRESNPRPETVNHPRLRAYSSVQFRQLRAPTTSVGAAMTDKVLVPPGPVSPLEPARCFGSHAIGRHA